MKNQNLWTKTPLRSMLLCLFALLLCGLLAGCTESDLKQTIRDLMEEHGIGSSHKEENSDIVAEDFLSGVDMDHFSVVFGDPNDPAFSSGHGGIILRPDGGGLSFGDPVNPTDPVEPDPDPDPVEPEPDPVEEGITWSFSDGVLTLQGRGEMENYYDLAPDDDPDIDSPYLPPWEPLSALIKRVVVGEGITHIGDRSFSMCSKLESVSLPEGLLSIGDNAFACCEKLQTIDLPDSLLSIGDFAFFETGLVAIDIPEGITYISDYAFSNCSSLQQLVLPRELTHIYAFAFAGCPSLQQVVLPEGATHIYMYAFLGCTSLQAITLPTGIENIYFSAFEGCDNLTDVLYLGSEEEWNQVSANTDGNEALLSALRFAE